MVAGEYKYEGQLRPVFPHEAVEAPGRVIRGGWALGPVPGDSEAPTAQSLASGGLSLTEEHIRHLCHPPGSSGENKSAWVGQWLRVPQSPHLGRKSLPPLSV